MSLPPPEHLAEIDRRLRAVRFEPRASLGSEFVGRARRGERPAHIPPAQSFAVRTVLGLVSMAAIAALVVGVTPTPRHMDVCCQNLDGGPSADDGMVLNLDARGRVTSLELYEDRDGSRSRSPADEVRFVRGAQLELLESPSESDIHTYVRCCEDLDGEGPADDGLLVVSGEPDQVKFVALVQFDGKTRVLR